MQWNELTLQPLRPTYTWKEEQGTITLKLGMAYGDTRFQWRLGLLPHPCGSSSTPGTVSSLFRPGSVKDHRNGHTFEYHIRWLLLVVDGNCIVRLVTIAGLLGLYGVPRYSKSQDHGCRFLHHPVVRSSGDGAYCLSTTCASSMPKMSVRHLTSVLFDLVVILGQSRDSV